VRRRGLAEIHYAALAKACRGPASEAAVWALLALDALAVHSGQPRFRRAARSLRDLSRADRERRVADALRREPLRPWLLMGGGP